MKIALVLGCYGGTGQALKNFIDAQINTYMIDKQCCLSNFLIYGTQTTLSIKTTRK